MPVPYKLNYFEIETGIDSTSTFIHTGDLTATKLKKYLATSNDILLGDGTTTSLSGLQSAITLTTNFTSGVATLIGNTLNIPNYTGGGGAGFVTLDTTQTITGAKTFTSEILSNRISATVAGDGAAIIASIALNNAVAGSFTNNTTLVQNSPTLFVQQQGAGRIATFQSSTASIILESDGDLTGVKDLTLSGSFKKNTISTIYNYDLPNANGTIALVGGAGVGTVTSVSALTLGTSGTDLSSSVANSTTTPVITLNVPTASATNRGALSSADWTTFNSKQGTITLTTTGSSNAATLIANTLNVPNYTLAGLGGVPTTRTITINGTSQDLSADRTFSVGTVTSVGLSMPSAFSVASSPITGSGTIAVTGAGLASQYIRGDGQLADFPTGGGGGGSSVSYYLNGSVNQGTFGGNVYKEMNKVPILGAGTDFTISSNGYIAQFLTDANDPNSLLIPAGNWNFETYFSASSGGGSPSFYVELYKYDGATFTLIASNSGSPELISFGTTIAPYFSALAVPETILLATDRLAVRFFVNNSGRTITLHTEGAHLCQIITTFTTGLQSLNGLTKQTQYFAVGTSGTDFAISSSVDTHTFNLPTASATNRGALSSANWSTFNGKQNTITLTTTNSSGSSTFIADVLNVPTYTLSGLGGVPTSRTITINGTSQDLSADRTYSVGTVTSVAALTLGTSGTDLSSTVANGTTTPVITLNVPTSSATNRGALSSADWSTFNGKQDALSGTGIVKSTAGVISYLTDPLPIANGGTGSATQTFVDLTTTQTIAGFKTFSSTIKLTNGTSNGFSLESGTTGFYASLKAPAGLAADILVTLPSTTGTLALTSAIPANPVGGTGTTNNLPKFTGASTIGDSAITDNGTTVTLVSRALSGTSATFSSTGSFLANTGVSTSAKYLEIINTGGNLTFGVNNSAGNTLLSGGAYSSDMYTAGATALRFGTNSTTRLTIASDGNVGIGTSSPSALLNTFSASTATQIIVTGADTTNQRLEVTDGTVTNRFGIFGRTNGDAGVLGTTTNHPLIFNTNGSERMRITSGGDVYIGDTTSIASTRLNVKSTVNRVTILTTTQTVGSAIEYYANTSTLVGYLGNGSFLTSGAAATDFILRSENALAFNTSGGSERMRITSAGNVEVRSAGKLIAYRSDNTRYGEFFTDGVAVHLTSSTDPLRISSADRTEFYTGATERVRIASTGVVTISNLAGSGSRTVTADSSGVLSAASDSRLKQEDLGHKIEGLSEILKIQPRAYKWLSDIENKGENATTEIGFFANEVSEIIPSAAPKGNDGYYGFYDRAIIAALVKSVQELKAEIDILKNK